MTIRHVMPGPRFPAAVTFNGMVFLSGCVASDFTGTLYQQTVDILRQVETILAACGSSKRDVLSVTAFMRDIADFEEHHQAWMEWLAEDLDRKPARTTVGAELFRPDCRMSFRSSPHKPQPRPQPRPRPRAEGEGEWRRCEP